MFLTFEVDRGLINMKKYMCFLLMILSALFFCWSVTVGAEVGVEIEISGEVTVPSSRITLGDIAQISGKEDTVEVDALKQELEDLFIKQAFENGYRDGLRRSLVERQLEEHGYLESGVHLNMSAEEAVLMLETKRLDYDDVLNKIGDYIARELDIEPENIELDLFLKPGEVIIPETGKIMLDGINLNNIPGSINPRINVFLEDQFKKTVYLGLDVSVWQYVYEAREDIAPGMDLKRDVFDKKQIKLDSADRKKLVSEWETAVLEGAKSDQRIREGSFLKIDAITYKDSPYRTGFDVEHEFEDPENRQARKQEEIEIRWGDEMKATVSIGGINISTIVRARETGTIGDIIEVENIESGEIITGRIKSSEEIIID